MGIKNTVEYAISTLLTRPAIHLRNIKPETQLCIDLADTFRSHVRAGRYRGLFCHIPNEGKRSAINGAVMKAMGLIPGAPDYVFAWGDDMVFIEMKQPLKKQNQNQKYFAAWCKDSSVTYTVCHSVKEVEDVLRALGGL